ncbi:MAG: hypothetical protein ABJA67_09245 [Chthonomonadales bacterium]
MSKELARLASDQATAMMRHFESELDRDGTQMIALFEWQGFCYAGFLRFMFPEKPYIAIVTKMLDVVPNPVSIKLRKEKGVPIFRVHPRLEFAGPRYLLGVSGLTLCSLSGEDVLYCLIHSRNHPVRNFATGADMIGFDAA